MRIPFHEPVLQRELATPERPVWLVEVLPIHAGQVIRLEFLSQNSEWRQGVWLGTEGRLVVDGIESPQFVLWEDTAPRQVDVHVLETDGFIRLYNCWSSGRQYAGDRESQSATSGMVREDGGEGRRVYGCNDIGFDPDFTKLRFAVDVV